MEKDALQLWFAYPDDLLDEEATQACLRLLSADEVARWRGYKFDRSKREYLATHALARTALSHCRGVAPETLRFRIGTHGKPSLDPDCGLRFNLSNSLGLVVCLIGEAREVGVDVEPRARAKSILEVASRVFSPMELTQLEELPPDQRPQRYLQLWTLKEAYIKARSMGFKLPLREFSFLFDEPNAIRLELKPVLNDDAARWRFCVVDHAEHCVALMVENSGSPQLHIWEARPGLVSPRSIDSISGAWHPRSST